jgi:uncharacterized membrane protein HdeD (DUF308 family)
MAQVLIRNWWAFALRGALGILLGLAAFLFPGITLGALVLLFGAYAVVDGVFAVVAGVRAAEHRERWGALLLEGIAGIAAGVLAFVWPALTALVLLYLIAAWSIIRGALKIAAAIRLRRTIQGEWLLGLNGAFSVLFGVLLIAMPAIGLLTLVWLVGAYAVLFGALLLGLAFCLRRHQVLRTSRGPDQIESIR